MDYALGDRARYLWSSRLSIDGGEMRLNGARRNHRITFRRRLCPLYRHRQ